MQAIWEGPLLHLGLDTMIGMMPFVYTGSGERAAEGYELRPDPEAEEPITLYKIGVHGRRLNRHLAELAARLSVDGFDVVVDHVITDDETLTQLTATCDPALTFLIGVHCDPETLAHRERSRGDRSTGLALGQLRTVHAGHRPYDFVVNSTTATPAQLAIETRDAVLSRPSKALEESLR